MVHREKIWISIANKSSVKYKRSSINEYSSTAVFQFIYTTRRLAMAREERALIRVYLSARFW